MSALSGHSAHACTHIMNSNTFDFVCDVDWLCFRLEIVRGVSVIAFSDSAVAYWFNVQLSVLSPPPVLLVERSQRDMCN